MGVIWMERASTARARKRRAAWSIVVLFLPCGWSSAAADLGGRLFVVFLIAVFFACHRFDDHARVRLAVRRRRPEILWSALLALWVVAISVSQGSSAKFIYFDF